MVDSFNCLYHCVHTSCLHEYFNVVRCSRCVINYTHSDYENHCCHNSKFYRFEIESSGRNVAANRTIGQNECHRHVIRMNEILKQRGYDVGESVT